MTVSALTNRNDYIGNGNVDTYAYGFKIFADSELLVTVRDTDDVETELTLTTHYTVTGAGSASGGNVVLVGTASFDWIDADGDLESGYVLTIKRNPALKQLTDIRNQGSFFPESHENQFDKLVMIDQKQQDEIDRSAKLPVTIDPDDVDMTLPVPVADKLIGWNSAGDGLENKTQAITSGTFPGTFSAGADASKSSSPTANDVYLATDTSILYACFSSGTWKVISSVSGLDAAKAATPKVGHTYIATDTGKVYRCFVAGTWTTALTFSNIVTMSGASIIQAMGANVTSAATTNIWTTDGDTIHIAGATGPITSFGTAPQAGAIKHVIFDSTPTITHNATSLILPGAANIVAAAGDSAIILALTTTNMKVLHYTKASGYSVLSQGGGIVGSCKNKYVTRPSVTQVTFTADEIVLEDSSNNKFSVRSVNVTAAITSSGANGLDAGAEGSSRWYALWLIRKSSDGTVAALLSESSSAPTLPSGYDQKALVSGVYNNSGSDFVDFVHEGGAYMYTSPGSMVSGDNSGVLTSFSTSAFMPSFLSTCILMKLDDGGVTAAVSPVSTGIGSYEGNKFLTGSDSSYAGELVVMRPRTANTLYYSGTGVSCNLYCHGFIVNKLGC